MKPGSLPSIPKYDIERHYWLHELRQVRAKKRVHGSLSKNDTAEYKAHQRELCKSRKEYYK